MTKEEKITAILTRLVDTLIKDSPFFDWWKAGPVDIGTAERFLTAFDSLVKSFPGLIAAGAARAQDEKTRTVLAVNLFQECGEGNASRTHYAIYRKFMETAGIDLSTLSESGFAAQWRQQLLHYIDTHSPPAALGALAAGEFLAQPALGRIYPVLRSHYPDADQEYFTKHLDLETEHVAEITSLLVPTAENKAYLQRVISGFKFGLSVWGEYFNRLAEHLMDSRAHESRR